MAKPPSRTSPTQRLIRQHSLSVASAGILVLWICLYIGSNPGTHLGSFFGNAIADWSGVLVMVFATKYLYERGSAESRRPPFRNHRLGRLGGQETVTYLLNLYRYFNRFLGSHGHIDTEETWRAGVQAEGAVFPAGVQRGHRSGKRWNYFDDRSGGELHQIGAALDSVNDSVHGCRDLFSCAGESGADTNRQG